MSFVPQGLEALQPFLERGDELHEHAPAVAHTCLAYAASRARQLGVPAASRPWLAALDARVAAAERALRDVVELQLACTSFAEQLLDNVAPADSPDSSDLDVAQAFHVASLVLEASTMHGPLADALVERQLHARGRAQDIRLRAARMAARAAEAARERAHDAARPPDSVGGSSGAPTSDGCEFVPAAGELAVGEHSTYRGSDGVFSPVTVVTVHRDDPPEVYYTILVDGVERGTVASRLGSLRQRAPAAAPPAEPAISAEADSALAMQTIEPAHDEDAGADAQRALPHDAPVAVPQAIGAAGIAARARARARQGGPQLRATPAHSEALNGAGKAPHAAWNSLSAAPAPGPPAHAAAHAATAARSSAEASAWPELSIGWGGPMAHGDAGSYSLPSHPSPAWATSAAAAQPLQNFAAAPPACPQPVGSHGAGSYEVPLVPRATAPAPTLPTALGAGALAQAQLQDHGAHGIAPNGFCAQVSLPATSLPSAPVSHGYSSVIPQGAPAIGAPQAARMLGEARSTPAPRDLAHIYAIFDAQSEARFAASAIEFSDRERAIAHLRKALILLAKLS